MTGSFTDRMEAQRTTLKLINQVDWPCEDLFALSESSIQRWLSVNRLGTDDEVVKLAREAGNALLFLANASQQQISSEYVSQSENMSAILKRLRAAILSKTDRL